MGCCESSPPTSPGSGVVGWGSTRPEGSVIQLSDINEELLNLDLCKFFFVSRDVFFQEEALPKFQDLSGRGVLQGLDVNFQSLAAGDLCKTHAVVSHRWQDRGHPDRSGGHKEVVKRFLDENPSVEWLWLDWCSLPQDKEGASLTPDQRTYTREVLNHCNLLYLFLPVLVIGDNEYTKRFWCLLELFLRGQGYVDDAIRPIEATHSIIWTEEARQSVKDTVFAWESVSVETALEKLMLDEVLLTNQSDRLLQVARLQTLPRTLSLLQSFEAEKDERARLLLVGAARTEEFAATLQRMGHIRRDLGHIEEAVAFYVEAERAYIAAGSTTSMDYARLLECMGASLSGRGSEDETVGFYERAQQAYISAGAATSSDLAGLLVHMGISKSLSGDSADALRLYEKAEQLYVAASATTTLGYVDPLLYLACLPPAGLLKRVSASLASEDKQSESLELLQRAEQAFVAAGATQTGDYAAVLASLGRASNSHSEALAYYKKAEQAYVVAGGTASTDYAGLLKDMGSTLAQSGKKEESMRCYERAEQAFVASGATASADYAVLLMSMGHN